MKPGAGTYNQSIDPLMRTAPKFGFGSCTRPEMASKTAYPGPGSYTAKNYTGKEGPSKTMHSTLNYSPRDKEMKGKPGPGTYRHERNMVLPKANAWKIGSAVRRDLNFESMKKF